MSFLLDPPALFVLGILLYIAGIKLKMERLAKITIGLLIVLSFILFSLMLYADIFRCVFPWICNNLSGSDFMFHSDITGIHKKDVPLLVVIFLFLLYPLWIYLGYASSLVIVKSLSRRRRFSKEVYSYKDVKCRKKQEQPEYSVVRYMDEKRGIYGPEQAVRAALNDLGGMKKFVKPGDNVLIKVNICGGVPELRGTYTSKEVAGYVVDMVKEAGGKPKLCDADMVWTKFWSNAKEEGWIEWAKMKDVAMVNLSETKIAYFDFGGESVLQREIVSMELLDADVIISIPAMKTHIMTGVTLGMKNMYGTLPEIDKAKYHKKGIDEVIYWINHAFTPNLTIIDGTIGGEAVGPLSCQDVDFRTIVASNNVVTADAIAAQLMGFDNPVKDIRHLELAQSGGLGDASLKFDFTSTPPHISDRRWKLPDPDVAKFYTYTTHLLLKFPGWETLFNLGADVFLFDASRLPLIKYFTPAFLAILNDIVKWSMEKSPDSPASTKRKRMNLTIFIFLTILSIYWFVSGGYFANSSFEFALGIVLAVIVGAPVAMRMKTAHLLAVIFSSILVSYAAEHFAPLAGMWRYLDGGSPPAFALFLIPIFIIVILGISLVTQRFFAYVSLEGSIGRIVPFAVILIAMIVFMQFEGYFAIATTEVTVMYAAFALLGLFHCSKQTLEWNFAIAVSAVALGGSMEFLGASSGLWIFAFGEKLPVFISFTWALNVWAVCGIAEISGINLREALAD